MIAAGIKPELADIVRRLAKEWGLSPLKVQAISWSSWLIEMPPKAKTGELRK